MDASHTPPRPIKRKEASTITKTRFFNAFDDRAPGESLKSVRQKLNIPYSYNTTWKWLKQRRKEGRIAYRQRGKHHTTLSAVPDKDLDMLINPKNPVHT